MADKASLKELVEYMAKALVDTPQEVKVEEVDMEGGTLYELRVGKGDIGKVIGKQGRTARSMRMILEAASIKQDRATSLEIIE